MKTRYGPRITREFSWHDGGFFCKTTNREFGIVSWERAVDKGGGELRYDLVPYWRWDRATSPLDVAEK
jgi:hypothetical protein